MTSSISNDRDSDVIFLGFSTVRYIITPNLDQRARELYNEYNKAIFGNKLPSNMAITWNNRLSTMAGRTYSGIKNGVYSVWIELSSKLIDREERLKQTLCHEMCHAAVRSIDKIRKSPAHGLLFKRWAKHAMAIYPHLSISRCHSYEIVRKYMYRCISIKCGKTYGRRTKMVNSGNKRCAFCMSPLKLDVSK